MEYFDYYLLHSMNKDYLELAEKIGAFDFAAWKKPREKSVISVSPSTIQRTCWTKS